MCIDSVNITYERQRFNQRMQDKGECFDTFIGNAESLGEDMSVRVLGRKEFLIRDHLVVAICSDNARQKI